MTDEPSVEALFDDLCYALNAAPDRRGEVHVPCPACGKEPSRGQTHFSFSLRGGHCFVCNTSLSLKSLHRQVLGDTWTPGPVRVRRQPKRRRQRRVEDFASVAWQARQRRYEEYPDRVARWQEYKPLHPLLIDAYRLGVGAFPKYSSRCEHERLMVPLIAENKIVGYRGRTIGCECGKWLAPAGSQMILFHGERLNRDMPGPGLGMVAYERAVAGSVLWIVENPMDALLLEFADPSYTAVATLGVSMWQPEWSRLVARSGAEIVFVAYDNDRPGNGGGAVGRAVWLADHPQDIEPNGIKLVNLLREAGARQAELFDWRDKPLKMDIGDVVAPTVRQMLDQMEGAR